MIKIDEKSIIIENVKTDTIIILDETKSVIIKDCVLDQIKR